MSQAAALRNRRARKRPAEDAAALGAYLALAILMTWPIALKPFLYVPAERMDFVTGFYNLWWFHKAVVELGGSPWFNPLIDYPHGYSMVLFPVWIPYDLLLLPFVHLGGAEGIPVVFNFFFIIQTMLVGYAGFLLARLFTRNSMPAFPAGAALAFLPFRFWNLTRWHVSCLELVAFALYFFLRAVKEDKKAPAVGLFFCLVLLAYTAPAYAADMALALPLIFVFQAPGLRGEGRFKRVFLRLLIVAGLCGLACLPFLVRVAVDARKSSAPLVQPEEIRTAFSANLAGFVVPGWNLKDYKWLADRLPALTDPGLTRKHGIMGYEIFLGFSVLAFALLGFIAQARKALPLAAAGVLFLFLSLGPRVHLGPHAFAFPALYGFLEELLPWLKVNRTPVREAALFMVCVCILSGAGISFLSEKTGGSRLAPLLFLLLVLFEFRQAPLALTRMPVPSFVDEMKNDPVPGSVLDIPFLPDIQRFAGFYQMRHERPLVIQLTRRINDPRFMQTAVFRWLDRPRVWLEMNEEEKAAALRELREELEFRKVRYLAAYPRFMEEEDRRGLRVVLSLLKPEAVLKDNEIFIVCRFKMRREK